MATDQRSSYLSQADSQTYGHGLQGRGTYYGDDDFDAGGGDMVPLRDVMPMDEDD